MGSGTGTRFIDADKLAHTDLPFQYMGSQSSTGKIEKCYVRNYLRCCDGNPSARAICSGRLRHPPASRSLSGRPPRERGRLYTTPRVANSRIQSFVKPCDFGSLLACCLVSSLDDFPVVDLLKSHVSKSMHVSAPRRRVISQSSSGSVYRARLLLCNTSSKEKGKHCVSAGAVASRG